MTSFPSLLHFPLMVGQLGLQAVIKKINLHTRDIWKRYACLFFFWKRYAFYLLLFSLNSPDEKTLHIPKIKLKI